jgi:hypothetical protein
MIFAICRRRTAPSIRSAVRRAPALPVAGAHQDMLRLARLINYGREALSEISITLDTHHRYDIAHPTFWQRADGSAVTPFTEISAAAVRAGEFQPRQPAALPRVLHYLDQLEATGRYRLMGGLHAKSVAGAITCMKTCAAYAQWEDAATRGAQAEQGQQSVDRALFGCDGGSARCGRSGNGTQHGLHRAAGPVRAHLCGR